MDTQTRQQQGQQGQETGEVKALREQVAAWLEEHLKTEGERATLVRAFSNGTGGFRVNGRARIRCKDGVVRSLIEAMREKGFTDECETEKYRVRFRPGTNGYADTFNFYEKFPPVEAAELF